MPPAIPNYDLGILITIDITLALVTVLIVVIGIWGIMRQNIRSQEIAERIDARLRRQYPDIDRDLQDIKNAVGQ